MKSYVALNTTFDLNNGFESHTQKKENQCKHKKMDRNTSAPYNGLAWHANLEYSGTYSGSVCVT